MKRPILIALIGYIIGIIWELYLEISIAPFVVILIVLYVLNLSSRTRKTYQYSGLFTIH